jgi:ATP-dependent RNA helicase DeaD
MIPAGDFARLAGMESNTNVPTSPADEDPQAGQSAAMTRSEQPADEARETPGGAQPNSEMEPTGPERPEFRFEDLNPTLQAAVARLGWKTPMPVQAKAIPILKDRRDLIVQSKTGSGKTGAFLLPMLESLDISSNDCQAMVLAPTRELAIQVYEELRKFTEGSPVRCTLLYGGVGYTKQIRELEAGVHIAVGTPGRVLDHLERGLLKVGHLRFLCLDEADEMLSMGFYPSMRKLKRWIPQKRQTMMFSATMPRSVRNLAKEFLYHPEFLSLTGDRLNVESMTHEMYEVPPMDKDRALVRVLEMENPANALIFCNRKSDVEYLYQFLQNAGYDADRISGDLTQRAREKVMGMIRERKLRFLVATDVAARGIDISDLEIVFQYDVPQDHESYVHRAGRTARAGKTGKTITFATYMDVFQLKQIRSKYNIPLVERELPSDEAVSGRVSERLTVLLEEQFRDGGSIMQEKLARFRTLADELAESENGRELIAMLLDEAYHRILHLPVQLPEEKIRFEEIGDRAPRPARDTAPSGEDEDEPRGGDGRRGPRRRSRGPRRDGSSGSTPAPSAH